MRIGTTVKIIPSVALDEMRMGGLANAYGTVVEVVHGKSGKTIGAWVRFPWKWGKSREWYIPEASIIVC